MATRVQRTEAIEQLTEAFEKASGIYLTNFDKISVERITKFRASCRKSGVKYLVVKNTLAKKALERCADGKKDLIPFLKGSTGVALAEAEATGAAKIIRDFQKENADMLPVKVAFVEGGIFKQDQVMQLADLPSREVLLSQLLSVLQAPMAGLAGALNGILSKLTGTLEAVKNKKETQA